MPGFFKKTPHQKLHHFLQKFVANLLFPSGEGDWFKNKKYSQSKNGEIELSSFDNFISKQRLKEGRYYHHFQGLSAQQQHIDAVLANGRSFQLEVMTCAPLDDFFKNNKPPGFGKHIVYFPGANTYYQACFRDITMAAKETGATLHAFNFPGTGSSTGKVREANDLINAGIAMINSLIQKGISPDNIILQGDCYGAAIALSVKNEYDSQSEIQLRLIANNAFKSFKAVIYDMIDSSIWLSNALKGMIKPFLVFTGWHVTPGKDYQQSGPYQCYIQHAGDQTLANSTLSGKIQKYRTEIITGKTLSKKREPIKDTCPPEYRENRDKLEVMHMVRVQNDAIPRLASKFGTNKHGQVNAHFADLCELEMLDGTNVYLGFVNEYIQASNEYIEAHPQLQTKDMNLPKPLLAMEAVSITALEAKVLSVIASTLDGQSNPLNEKRHT